MGSEAKLLARRHTAIHNREVADIGIVGHILLGCSKGVSHGCPVQQGRVEHGSKRHTGGDFNRGVGVDVYNGAGLPPVGGIFSTSEHALRVTGSEEQHLGTRAEQWKEALPRDNVSTGSVVF
jgi:hypothetical protein